MISAKNLGNDTFSNYYRNNGVDVYLSSIELSNYSELSDIDILSGGDILAFKYDEETYFDISDDIQYFYPVINIKYPHTAGEFVNSKNFPVKRVQEIVTFDKVFDDNQIYYFDIQEKNEILSSIGEFIIELTGDTECYRVTEDILSDDFPYCVEDARILNYLRCIEDSTTNNLTVDVDNKSLEAALSSKNLSIRNIEAEAAKTPVVFDMDDYMSKFNELDIEKFLRIAVSYKKDESGIVLYFNYYNYINSPFLKMNDGKLYIDTVAGTYLKLKSGESGTLDIVL